MAKNLKKKTALTAAASKRVARPKQNRKSLGRGLAALIPDDDMAFLSRIARGDESIALAADQSTNQDSAGTDSKVSGDTSSAAAKNRVKASADNPVSDVTQRGGDNEMEKSEQRSGDDAATHVQWLPVSSIGANPYQPRRTFAPQEMEDLARSIREHGVLQPIIVRPVSQLPGTEVAYQLVAGERRWRAAQQAELTAVPAIVREVNDQQALELALIENIQRHDISPLDAAHAYQRLATEFNLSQEKVAERVGKSRSAVANTLRLLDLPDEMQQAVEEGKLSEGHGRALLAAPGEGARRALFRRILRDGLSVREAERLSKNRNLTTVPLPDGSATHESSIDEATADLLTEAELKDIEQRLQRQVGTRLHIKPKKKGGQIVLEYFSLEELDRLVALLSQPS